MASANAIRVFGTALRRPTHSLLRQNFTTSTMGAIGRHTVNTTERLAALREHMSRHSVGAFVVPSEDQRERSDRCPIYSILSRELHD